jgi:hypothetical protein
MNKVDTKHNPCTAERRALLRAHWAGLSEAQKQRTVDKRRTSLKSYWAGLSEEQKRAVVDKRSAGIKSNHWSKSANRGTVCGKISQANRDVAAASTPERRRERAAASHVEAKRQHADGTFYKNSKPYPGHRRNKHTSAGFARLAGARSGRGNPMFGKTHRPTRVASRLPDGNRVCYRSTWEAAFAAYLAALRVDFQYEPKVFDFGHFTYLPDFFIPSLNLWVEIKGWMTPEGAAKIAALAAIQKVLVIDGRLYHEMGLRYMPEAEFK